MYKISIQSINGFLSSDALSILSDFWIVSVVKIYVYSMLCCYPTYKAEQYLLTACNIFTFHQSELVTKSKTPNPYM